MRDCACCCCVVVAIAIAVAVVTVVIVTAAMVKGGINAKLAQIQRTPCITRISNDLIDQFDSNQVREWVSLAPCVYI